MGFQLCIAIWPTYGTLLNSCRSNSCQYNAWLAPEAQSALPSCLQVVLKDFQHAAKAQRASVTPAEIQRYEEYNARHGAQYVQGTADGAIDGDDDDDW